MVAFFRALERFCSRDNYQRRFSRVNDANAAHEICRIIHSCSSWTREDGANSVMDTLTDSNAADVVMQVDEILSFMSDGSTVSASVKRKRWKSFVEHNKDHQFIQHLVQALGFEWNILDSKWSAKYELLRAFKAMHGHCYVATNQSDLGKWVNTVSICLTVYTTYIIMHCIE